MRTPLRLLVLVLTSVLAALALTVPAQAATNPYCGITWGSLDKSRSAGAGGYVDDVRAGRHACYDRLVIDIHGTRSYGTWHAGYVDEVLADPSGLPVPLRGGAFLQISLRAPTHTPNGTLTYAPADDRHLVNVAGFRTFRQVALTGSFEGVTTIALGVRARLPFRVVALTGIPGTANGTRVVLDVAHHW
ncbi:AMIN-like domain-containing (lipo)protein [Geodermatophilus sp. URMC 64]